MVCPNKTKSPLDLAGSKIENKISTSVVGAATAATSTAAEAAAPSRQLLIRVPVGVVNEVPSLVNLPPLQVGEDTVVAAGAELAVAEAGAAGGAGALAGAIAGAGGREGGGRACVSGGRAEAPEAVLR